MIELRKTEIQDVPFVKIAEADPANRSFVGQWSEAKHHMALAEPDIRHLIIEDAITNKKVGYTILKGLTTEEKALCLMRIVITEKNRGYGRATLEAVKKIAFEELRFHRLWLDVREKNNLAKRLYESCGFKEEGLLRDFALVDGKYESTYILSILEHEYEA